MAHENDYGSRDGDWELETHRFRFGGHLFIKALPESLPTVSDTESSDVDSVWSGSAHSSCMSSPSISGYTPSDLWMSSLASQDDLNVKDGAFSPARPSSPSIIPDQLSLVNEDSNVQKSTAGKAQASFIELPNFPVRFKPTRHVDYLSYNWREEDLWTSWRHLTAHKNAYSNGERLQNASWRTWEKTRSKLKTVSPETLNWLKDCDVTWLYGPFTPARRSVFEHSAVIEGSGALNELATRLSADTPPKKPILKKKPDFAGSADPEFAISRSHSAGSLWSEPITVGRAQPPKATPEADISHPLAPILFKHTKYLEPNAKPVPRSASQASSLLPKPTSRNARVHFSVAVEQRIVIDTIDDGDNDDAAIDDSDSDDDFIEMKAPKFERRASPTGLYKGTAPLPPAVLRWRSDEIDEWVIPEQRSSALSNALWKKKIDSPPPPQPCSNFPTESVLFDITADYKPEFEKDLQSDSPPRLSSCSTILVNTLATTERIVPDVDLIQESSPVRNRYRSKRKTEPSLAESDVSAFLVPSAVTSIDSKIKTELSPPISINGTVKIKGSNLVGNQVSTDLDTALGGENNNFAQRDEHGSSMDENSVVSSTTDTGFSSSDIEDEPFLFDIVELGLPSTEINLPTMTLQKRKRDWWFTNNQSAAASTLNSQGDFIPGLTQKPHRPSFQFISRDLEALSIYDEPPCLEHPTNDANEDTEGYTTTTESYSGDSLVSASSASVYERLCDIEEASVTEEHLAPALNPMQRAMVDRVMEEFWSIFNQNWGSAFRQHAGHSASSSNGQTLGQARHSSLSPLNTRKRQKRDDEPPDNEEKAARDRPGPMDVDSGCEDPVRYACPFRKHDPQQYNLYMHSVCALSHWPSISRVKYASSMVGEDLEIDLYREHLYRAHRVPVHCKRCWTIFKTQVLLDAHLTVSTSEICDLSPGVSPDGITPEQERRLRSRKKVSPDQSEEERWRDIYKLLFPNEAIPSPYFEPLQEEAPMSPDSRELAGYEEYIRRELPRLVRSNIEETVRREMRPLEASLISNLVCIVQDCQDMVFRSYRQAQGLCPDSSPVISPMQEQALPPPATERPWQTGTSSQNHQSDFIDTLFQTPPTEGHDLLPPTLAPEDIPTSTTGPSTDGLSSEADSGYASEQVLLCLCCGPCTCGHTREEESNMHNPGHENFPWSEWAAFSPWDPLHSLGSASGWQAGQGGMR